MVRMGMMAVSSLAMLTAFLGTGNAQPVRTTPPPAVAGSPVVTIEEPNAQRTKEELSRLLEHYAPTLRNVVAIDPSLLGNQAFLAAYPALSNFLIAHPEILRSPAFYVGDYYSDRRFNHDPSGDSERAWERVAANLFILAGFGMAFGVVTWLIRTIMDYRPCSIASAAMKNYCHTSNRRRVRNSWNLRLLRSIRCHAAWPRRWGGFSGPYRRAWCRWRWAWDYKRWPAGSMNPRLSPYARWASWGSLWDWGS